MAKPPIFLSEYYPKQPSTIIVKNKFYPDGLTEEDIYNYYIDHKSEILKWIGNRFSAFSLRIDGSVVIKRNINSSPIKLTPTNYSQIITGRTNSIYVVHPTQTNYFIIDIDPGPNLTQKHSLTTAKIILQEIDASKYEILLTSTTGVHLIVYVNKTQNINQLRKKIVMLLTDIVQKLNKNSKIQYTIHKKGRKINTLNLDMSSMFENSLHLCRHSLTKEFLICDDETIGLKKIYS